MKKKNIILGLLSLCAIVSLASCNKTETPNNGNNTIDNNGNNNGNNGDNNGNNGDETVDNSFTLVVKMPDGTPAKGVLVQWCDDVQCYQGIKVDENGKASSSSLMKELDENGTYYAHIISCPDGYTYNPYEIVQTKANKHETMTLKKLNDYKDGADGTQANPYDLNVGYSLVETTEKKNSYFTFKPTEAGTYTIESIAATTEVDKKINAGFFKGTDLANMVKDTANDARVNGKNFKYDLVYTADDLANNVVYAIIINVESQPECEFTLMVTKK